MAYSPAGDLIQSIGEAAAAKTRALQAQEMADAMERVKADFNILKDWNAGNLAEKVALRAALAKLQPDHPLVVNAALQERIRDAGCRAIALTDDWDAVREAGTSFRY